MLPRRKSRTEIAKEAFKELPDTIKEIGDVAKKKLQEYNEKKITDDKYRPILEDKGNKTNEI